MWKMLGIFHIDDRKEEVLMARKKKIHVCPSCGHTMDRGHQAAINLREEALRIISENIAQIKRIAV